MRSIVFASGKGGVGKSTVTLNLGLTLAAAGKRVVVVDADLEMANIGILLGIDATPISLHNVLSGENEMQDAVYAGPNNMRYVPASLSPEKMDRLDLDKLPQAIKKLEDSSDFVLIDCPPGLGTSATAAIKSAKEIVIVSTPEPSALADALKVRALAERHGVKIVGVVLNMVLGDRSEIKKEDFETVMEVPVIGILPEDVEVRRSAALQVPVIIRAPGSNFSRSMRLLASRLSGEKLAIQETKVKKGLLSSLMEFFGRIFGRK
ncbi:MAG: cell division ATPase MinD [Candidatus Micrarchaeota archaeon]